MNFTIPQESIAGGFSMVSGAAKELVDSGFYLGREQVVALHAQLGAWLEANL